MNQRLGPCYWNRGLLRQKLAPRIFSAGHLEEEEEEEEEVVVVVVVVVMVAL